VSDISDVGRAQRRDADEESVVSALDEGAAKKKGDGDNESVISALDDAEAGKGSGSRVEERILHLD